MHPYERWMLQRYLASALCAKSIDTLRRATDEIRTWAFQHRKLTPSSVDWTQADISDLERRNTPTWRRREAKFQAWRRTVFDAAAEPAPPISPLQRRLDWIGDACGLNPTQRRIFGVYARIVRVPAVKKLIAAINQTCRSCEVWDYREVRPLFDKPISRRDLESGMLVRLGLLENDSSDSFRITGLVETLLGRRRIAGPQLCDLLLGARAEPKLMWDDFAHLRGSRELAARLVACGGRAANILLYGAPGTGKSEFAKSLGSHLGLPVYFLGEDNDGAEPKRQERVAALTIANAVGAATENMLLVVDEADDLFAGVDEDNAATRQGSKAFMHRLIEKSRAPTIWIVNDVARLGPAVVRRMNLVIRFGRPGVAVRQRIVERLATREKLPLDAVAVRRLASLPAAPALYENAIRSAARIAGGVRGGR